MLVKDLMTREVAEVSADTLLLAALEQLEKSDSVMAVADGGRLQGSLTEHDIALWQAAPDHDPRTAQVRDAIDPTRPFLAEDVDVRDAARIMQMAHVDGLVVTRDDRAIGKITLADLAAKIGDASVSTSQPPVQVMLQPLAAPSILGFFGLAAASFVVGAHMAGWYGNTSTPLYLLAFVALFGGLTQFAAGMWSFRARDALATAIHGTWGAFWGAYGLLYLLVANGTLAIGAVNQNYGFWFIPLAAIMGVGVFAALADNVVLSGTLLVLTVASGIAAIATLVGATTWVEVSGWLFTLGAVLAWYLASALLLEGSWRRVILPLGRTIRGTNRLGSTVIEPAEYQLGEPGVRAGQ